MTRPSTAAGRVCDFTRENLSLSFRQGRDEPSVAELLALATIAPPQWSLHET
jgi:hypothetical protein